MNAETELFEIELGYRAAFDLYHLDDVMFCKHGLREIDTMCYRGCDFDPR